MNMPTILRSSFILLCMAALSYVLLTAHSSGVAQIQNQDRTGAPGSNNPCSQCHSGGNFGASTTLEVIDPNTMLSISEYVPGETYIYRVTVGHSGASRFGFQSTAVFDNTQNAGTFQSPGANVQLEDVGGRHIVEQSTGSLINVFESEWVAPEAGNGQVGFYASGLAANGNGSSSGDQYAGAELFIAEAIPSVAGCTYESASNYNPAATTDDGSCQFEVPAGCTDPTSCDFNALAQADDGSCAVYPGDPCDDLDPTTFNDAIGDDCNCSGTVTTGCTYVIASNYDPSATRDDGSCVFPVDPSVCQGDFDGNLVVNAGDLLTFLSTFGNICN